MDGYRFSTGLKGLDAVLNGILPGDNVVWQIDRIEDYQALVTPCIDAAKATGRPIVYVHFSNREPLLTADADVQVRCLSPHDGFEPFVTHIHDTIREAGRGAYYVFDCISELANAWHSDVMLGNFFKLTCPYLFDLETLAYFALFRNHHSAYAIEPIMETTQLFLDVYSHQEIYIRPIKVQHRYSATMNMLHRWQDNTFTPVSDSTVIAQILTSAKWSGLHADRIPGFWERAFLDAQDVKRQVQAGVLPPEAEQRAFEGLIPMVITRDRSMEPLVRQYLTLDDVLDVRRRMIGSGLIGGKSVGMLLARAILRTQAPDIHDQLEAHDSFFIGSDVFYSFLVRNGIWWTRQKQRDTDDFYENATRARRLIITGAFSQRSLQQFQEMVDYFGQSPFIVRSSSLLEDNFGNAFAGKYESVFCANQGPRSQRMEDFLAAVKAIYASSMSEKALRYRAPTVPGAACWSRMSRWPCWSCASLADPTDGAFFPPWRASASRSTPMCGIRRSIPPPVWSGWSSGWEPGQLTARTMTIPGWSRSMSLSGVPSTARTRFDAMRSAGSTTLTWKPIIWHPAISRICCPASIRSV